MIQLYITLNDKNAKVSCQKLNEPNLIEQDKDAIDFLTGELRRFLLDNREPVKYENKDCGLKIAWRL